MPTTFGQVDQSLRVTENGFVAFSRGAEREFLDADVIGLTIHRERAPGSQTTVETLQVRVVDGNDTPVFQIESEYTGADDDFAASFRERLRQALLLRIMETLHAGGEFDAGQWAISLEGVLDKQSGTRIPIEEISVAEWREGDFCVGGEGYLTVRFATDAENTHLLPSVLQYLLPKGTIAETHAHSATGRMLAEFRDTPQGVVTAIGISAGVAIALAVGFLQFTPLDAGSAYVILGAAALVFIAMLCTVYYFFGEAVLLRHLDNALVRVHGEKEQVIPLDRLASFSAKWTDVYVNGVYSGTTVRFDFTPDSLEHPTIAYESSVSHGKPKYDELQTFQGRVAAVVAQRMKEQLEREGRVPWTARLTILPGGIEFRKKASTEPIFYEFSQVTRCQVEQGMLKMAVDGAKRPTIVESTDQKNFFPGLALVQHLASGETAESPHDSEAHA